jgi:hypothetical protein
MRQLIFVGLCLVLAVSFTQETFAWVVVRGPYYRPPVVVAPRYGYYAPPAYYYRPPVYVAPPCGYYPYPGCY